MTIAPNLDPLARKPNQPFNVKLVWRNVPVIHIPVLGGNSFGFEYNNLATFRLSEVIGEAVHEEMIAVYNPQVHDGITFIEMLTQAKPGALGQSRAAIIGREPNPVSLSTDLQSLNDVEDKQFHRLIDFEPQD